MTDEKTEAVEAEKKPRRTPTKAATPTVPAIYTALQAVTANFPTLEKNGVGPASQGSYKFLSVDDVLVAAKPLLNEHKVIVIPTLVDKGFHYNTAELKSDGRVAKENIHAWVEYKFQFISAEDASQIELTVIGEGIDGQDKAIRKATTSATKIAFINAFTLVTGEIDPDAQDGGADNQSAGAAAGKPNNALTRAQGQASAPSGPSVADLQREIKELAGETGIDYVKIGNRVGAGKQWGTDPAILTEVLHAIRRGEIE